jgi:hypothetical protein
MAIITLDALITAEAILPSSKPSEMQLRKCAATFSSSDLRPRFSEPLPSEYFVFDEPL